MEETPLFFPLFVSLQGKKCLIVGGGTIASRRAETLSQFQCEVEVIAPRLSEAMKKLEKSGMVQVKLKQYETGDCMGAFLVVAATDDRQVNRQIGREAKEAGAFVSVADAREECSFFFPGVAVNPQQKTVIGVTASGQNHKLVKELTKSCRKIVEECHEKS